MQPTAFPMTASPDESAAPGPCRCATHARHDDRRGPAFSDVLADLIVAKTRAPELAPPEKLEAPDSSASDVRAPDAHAGTPESDANPSHDAVRIDIYPKERTSQLAPSGVPTKTDDNLFELDPISAECARLPREVHGLPLDNPAGPDSAGTARHDRDRDTSHRSETPRIGDGPFSLRPASDFASPPPNPLPSEARDAGPFSLHDVSALRAPSQVVAHPPSMASADAAAPPIGWAERPWLISDSSLPGPLAERATPPAAPTPGTIRADAKGPDAHAKALHSSTLGKTEIQASTAQPASTPRTIGVEGLFSAASGMAVPGRHAPSESRSAAVTALPATPPGQTHATATLPLALRDAVPEHRPGTMGPPVGIPRAASNEDPISPLPQSRSRPDVPTPSSVRQAALGAQPRTDPPAMVAVYDALEVMARPATAQPVIQEIAHAPVASQSGQTVSTVQASQINVRTRIGATTAPGVVGPEDPLLRPEPLEEIGLAARQPARGVEAGPIRETLQPGPPPAPMTRQNVEAIRSDPGGRIELWLEPAELGRLRIQMLPGEQGLTCKSRPTGRKRWTCCAATAVLSNARWPMKGSRSPISPSGRGGVTPIPRPALPLQHRPPLMPPPTGRPPMSLRLGARTARSTCDSEETAMQIDTAISPAFSAGAGSTADQRATTLSSDFETFLQMLVAQAENQDPLNPIDSSDYAAQLATFASVEQQVLTNDLLQAMQAQLSGSAMAELSGWVGAEVLVAAPVMFDGAPIALAPQLATGATSAQLIVRDAFGTVVGREALSVPPGAVTWAGTDGQGRRCRPAPTASRWKATRTAGSSTRRKCRPTAMSPRPGPTRPA